MNKNDLSHLGDDLKRIMNDTLNSKDYKKMGQDVGSTVNNALELALEEARKAINSINIDNQFNKNQSGQIKKPNQGNASDTINPKQHVYHPVQNKIVQSNTSKQIAKTPLKKLPDQSYFPHYPVGKVKGTLLSVFGGIGIGVFGILIFTFGFLGAGPWVIGGLLMGAISSLLIDGSGSTIRKRLKRYKRYLSLFYGKDSYSIKELADYCGNSERFVVRDLKKMISIGMFPQGHIDGSKSTIMLTRGRYEKYLIEERASKEKQKSLEDKGGFDEYETQKTQTDHDRAIEEGLMFIARIDEAKSGIQDGEVLIKIHRMEEVIGKIIGYIKEHPNQLTDVRRFMQYYLPTTLKLLHAYREFESQTIQGENITTTKKEIKEALDTINLAFENLFDGLFASTTMDISTDISVLQTMMAQEGLMERDFDVTNTEGGTKNE